MGIDTWTKEEIDDLVYMVENGFRQKEIAMVLDKTVHMVGHKIRKMGLKSPLIHRERDGLIYCLACKTFKEKELFQMVKDGDKIRYYSQCKRCVREKNIIRYNQKRLQKAKEKEEQDIVVKTKQEFWGADLKQCVTCKEIKHIEEFNWARKYKQLNARCKKCQVEATKKSELKRLIKSGY